MNLDRLAHAIKTFGSAIAGFGTVAALGGAPEQFKTYAVWAAAVGFVLSCAGSALHTYAAGEDEPKVTVVPPTNTTST